MKLLAVLFALLAVVLNSIMPAFAMNPLCNCKACPDKPYAIDTMRSKIYQNNWQYQPLPVQTVYG